MLPEMFASAFHVPGRCFKLRKLTPLLLCKLGLYRETYGNDDTSTVSLSAHGRKMYSGILGGTQYFGLLRENKSLMPVYNFGSINIDHVYQVPHLVQPGETLSSSDYQSVLGGKGANQSIAAAQAGLETKHIGAVNINDSSFIDTMQSCGVDCSLVRKEKNVASGHAIIQVDANAENCILLYGGANQIFSKERLQQALSSATRYDYFLFQNETNALADAIHTAHAKGMTIVFNPAPMTAQVSQLPLDKVDLLIVNEIEAQQLTHQNQLPDIKKALLQQYPNSRFVITLGKQGACYLDSSQDIFVNAFKVKAVDTTAAGDTFIGFFLAQLAADKDVKEALHVACAASALAVTKPGAAQSIPSQAELEAFLVQHNKTD